VADNHDFTMISAQVGCEIRAMRDNAGTRLDAVIYASGNVTGTYVFEVRRLRSGKLEQNAEVSLPKVKAPQKSRKPVSSCPLKATSFNFQLNGQLAARRAPQLHRNLAIPDALTGLSKMMRPQAGMINAQRTDATALRWY
jgi:hypothetical protein